MHGGAWRDPRNTFEDFIACTKYLLSTDEPFASNICGVVSIDHRLSPHPEFFQDPATTPITSVRAARHPDHLMDVYAALAFVQNKYGITSNYILIGHSSGATLAYQLIMGHAPLQGCSTVTPPTIYLPTAIIGIYGIYDLVGLNTRYKGQYAEFMGGAFGDDRQMWHQVSPSLFSGRFKKNWVGGRYALLADSAEDSLLDSHEVSLMEARLAKEGINLAVVDDLVGDHDFVWKDGSQVARLVSQCLESLRVSD